MSVLNCVGCVDYMSGSKSCMGQAGCVGFSNFGVGLKFYERKNVHAQTWIECLVYSCILEINHPKKQKKNQNVG